MRRLGIFLFHDTEGRVPAHVRSTLAAFRPWLDTLIFVSNGPVEPESYARVADLVTRLVVRPNHGFDVWGYREGLTTAGFDRLAEWDEVVLFNYTFFTAPDRIAPMFRTMAGRDLDFWGITEYDDGEKSFLQSYFLVTRAALHGTRAFRDYWEGMPAVRSIEDSLQHHEFRFTRHFRDAGWRGAPYVENAPDWTGNTTLIDIAGLHARGMPVIKYRAFTFDATHLERRGGRSGAANLAFAAATGSYAMEEIWDYLIAQTRPDDLIRNAGLIRLVADQGSDAVSAEGISVPAPALPAGAPVLVALSCARTLGLAFARLRQLPPAQVFVTTADPAIAAAVQAEGWACRPADASGLALPVWGPDLAGQAPGLPVVCLSDFPDERERYFFSQSLFSTYWDPLLSAAPGAWMAQAAHLGLVFVPPDAVEGRERMVHPLSRHGQNWAQAGFPDWAMPALGQRLWPWRGNCVLRSDLLSDAGFAAGLAEMAPHVAHRPREVFAGLEGVLPQLARRAGAAAGLVVPQGIAPALLLRAGLVEQQADERLRKAVLEFRHDITRLRADLGPGTAPGGGLALEEADVTARLTGGAEPGAVRLDLRVAGGAPVVLVPGAALRLQIDNLDITPGRIHVRGWAFDSDNPDTPLFCGLLIDGVLAGRLQAVAEQRPDVRAAFPDLALRTDTGFDIQRRPGAEIDPDGADVRLCLLDGQLTRLVLGPLSQAARLAPAPSSGPAAADKGPDR